MPSYEFRSSIHFLEFLNFFDLFVIVAILGATFGIIFLYKRSHQHQPHSQLVEHVLMGRRLSLPLFVATLVASWYGQFLGVAQLGFEKGIFSFFAQGVFWYASYLIFAFFLLKKIKKSDAMSLPELILKTIGPRSSKLSALFNFFDVLPVGYALSLGTLITMIFGGSFFFNMVLGVTFITLYTLCGGLQAVVLSDFLQFLVMCSSVAVVAIFSCFKIGSPFTVLEQLPVQYLDPCAGESFLHLCVWGIIALTTLINPIFYQRCFAAKSEKIAFKGILISTFIWICFDLCMILGSLFAKLTVPQALPEEAYLVYALQLLPSGLRGFLIAGILCTIFSTFDSYLFSGATTLICDLSQRLKLKFTTKKHATAVVITSILSITIASCFEHQLWKVWLIFGSYSSACLFVPLIFILGFHITISDTQFMMTCCTGIVSVSLWLWKQGSDSKETLPCFYIGCLATLVCFILFQAYNYWNSFKKTS